MSGIAEARDVVAPDSRSRDAADPATPSRSPATPASTLLSLQRVAGNRAVTAIVAGDRPRVHRCGETPPDRCACHVDDDRGPQIHRAAGSADEPTIQRLGKVLALQRTVDDGTATGLPGASDRPVVQRKQVPPKTVTVRIKFPFAKLGIPKTTPSTEMAVRFIMWYFEVPLEVARKHWAAQPEDKKATWASFPHDHLDAGFIYVHLEKPVGQLADPTTASDDLGEGRPPDGRSEGHDDRAEDFRGLDARTRQQINDEANRRYFARTGLDEKIKKGEKGKAEAWLRIRDEVLAEREFLKNLPTRTKRFLFSADGMELEASKYQQFRRLAKLVGEMNDEQMNTYLSEAKPTTDLDAFEQSLKKFLTKGPGGGTGPDPGGGEPGGEPGGTEPGGGTKPSGKPGSAKGSGSKDKPNKKGSKYGRFGLLDLPEEVIAVLETAAEILGDPEEMTDLVDLLDEINDLHNVVGDIVNILADPDNLLLMALGVIDNPAIATLDRWVFKPEKNRKNPKGRQKGAKAVLAKVRKVLPTLKSMLKPVFAARRKAMGVQFEASLLIDKLPAALTSVLEAGNAAGAAAKLRSLAEEVSKKVVDDLKQVPETLADVEKIDDLELIDKEEVARIISKLTVKLAGGIYGKAASKVGLDEVIADVAKHGLKHAVPDELIDGINGSIQRITTEVQPLIAGASGEVTKVLEGLDTVLRDHLVPGLQGLVARRTGPMADGTEEADAKFWAGVSASGGNPLPEELVHRMGPVLRGSVHDVRLHTDVAAAEASHRIGADAFTIGRDVYFGHGKFDPSSSAGLELIGHELTHVAQNRARASVADAGIHRRKTKKSIRQRLAKRIVGRVVRGTGKTKRSIVGPAFIDYGYLDSKGRPQGIIARLVNPIKHGSPATKSIRPPGFKGAAGGHARCHLLGDQLGGSGRDPRNLVACHQAVNNTDMKTIENTVKKAVLVGEIVLYKVIPEYEAKGRMPTRIRVIAKGDQGLQVDETLANRK